MSDLITVSRKDLGHSTRGFSLIEVMVVVALLGIIAALAAPTLGPMKANIELDGVAEQVSGFLGRARAQAMSQRRCVRVRIPNGLADQPPAVLVAEVLNTYDCDQNPLTAVHADGGTAGASGLWIEFARVSLNSGPIRFQFDPVPPATATGGPGSSDPEIRFAATGRLWFNPLTSNPPTGDGVIRVQHIRLGPDGFKEVLVKHNGPICHQLRGRDLTGGPNWECP